MIFEFFHRNCRTEIESWRARALAAETTVELIKEIMTRERERADRLEERLSPKSHKPQNPPDMNPVGGSRSNWPRIKRELEREHRVKDGAPTTSEVRGNA